MSDELELETLIEKSADNKSRGETALWKHWAAEVGAETSWEDSDSITYNPDFTLDPWELGYVEAYTLQQVRRREDQVHFDRELHNRGMLDYYKGYEAGLKNAKKHLIKLMVEDDKVSEERSSI